MNDKLISKIVFQNVGFAAVQKLFFGVYRKAQVSRKDCLYSLLFALAFFVFAFSVSAQPTMSRGEQRLSINYDECMRRAENAFSKEGWVNIGKGGAFVNAFKENHGAYIMCNVAPENKMWVNIVVASSSGDSGVPGSERVKLQRRMGNNENPNLQGSWEFKGAPTSIRQDGDKLWFTNESNDTSEGYFESQTNETLKVRATKWGGLIGTISSDGNTIEWANGTTWKRRQ